MNDAHKGDESSQNLPSFINPNLTKKGTSIEMPP